MNASWKVVLAFIAVFIAGTIFGGGFAVRISQMLAQPDESQRKRVVTPLPRGEGGQPPLATQLLRRFAENLELTNEQRDKLRPLVVAAENRIAQIRQDSLEETERILRKLQEDFRAELAPDQRRKLNRMQQRQKEAVTQERLRRQQQQQQQQGQFGRPNPQFNQGQPQRPNLRPQGQPPGPNFGPNPAPQQNLRPPPGQPPPPPNGPEPREPGQP